MTQECAKQRAVVLTSGGLDSTTVLALVTQQGYECFALSVDYGQRHRAELDAAQHLAKHFAVNDHLVVTVDLRAMGGSALTDEKIKVPEHGGAEIPVTYVPARNTVLLSLALGYAETVQASNIFIGANAVDYSGYPDCRPEFIEAFEQLANVATKAAVEGQRIKIHAPLINMSKAQIIQTGVSLGVNYADTVSCYQATDKGVACGVCDSCCLRKQGFTDANIDDPTRYVSGSRLLVF